MQNSEPFAEIVLINERIWLLLSQFIVTEQLLATGFPKDAPWIRSWKTHVDRQFLATHQTEWSIKIYIMPGEFERLS